MTGHKEGEGYLGKSIALFIIRSTLFDCVRDLTKLHL